MLINLQVTCQVHLLKRYDGTHSVWVYGATGMDRNEVILVTDVNPSYDLTMHGVNEHHMDIYLLDRNNNPLKVSLFMDGTVRDNLGDITHNSWTDFAHENPEAKIRTTWADGVRLNCNFIIRMGWSDNTEAFDFSIRELNY
ncbi:hypothetical protein [Flammeovirga aprica]|uniref:Uncharacterized protein n=1 Tax=Flammeovirga aprica JL-4 TaxID=694437 RepID=A0A7X9S183_9BACT|nr:hypothetical protein [Flammeovirga aprica]NME72541.1 hypothetical protein [Flammeovirga aprica JL-4]